MEQTIRKATLAPTSVQVIEIPSGSIFIHAAEQHGNVTVWFRCDPKAGVEKRRIAIAGTDHPIEKDWKYVGTASLKNGFLIFHVFEIVGD